MKKLILVVLAVVLVATMVGTATTAFARPPGIKDDICLGRMLYKFNIIAVPQDDWGGDINNEGHRIFFTRVENGTIGKIEWRGDASLTGIDITDCDGTDGTAEVKAEMELNIAVALRVHGKKTDSLGLGCVVEDPLENGVNMVCIQDYFEISKGKRFTKIMSGWFSDDQEYVTWTLDSLTGFRMAEVRVYENECDPGD